MDVGIDHVPQGEGAFAEQVAVLVDPQGRVYEGCLAGLARGDEIGGAATQLI
jgi:hypothetical protein